MNRERQQHPKMRRAHSLAPELKPRRVIPRHDIEFLRLYISDLRAAYELEYECNPL